MPPFDEEESDLERVLFCFAVEQEAKFFSQPGMEVLINGIGRENAILRVRLADRKVEMVFDGKGTDLVFGNLGPWFGSTPDGWPLELLDAGTHDIYALDWDAP